MVCEGRQAVDLKLSYKHQNIYQGAAAVLNAARDVQQVIVRATQAVLGRAAVAGGAGLVALPADGGPV